MGATKLSGNLCRKYVRTVRKTTGKAIERTNVTVAPTQKFLREEYRQKRFAHRRRRQAQLKQLIVLYKAKKLAYRKNEVRQAIENEVVDGDGFDASQPGEIEEQTIDEHNERAVSENVKERMAIIAARYFKARASSVTNKKLF